MIRDRAKRYWESWLSQRIRPVHQLVLQQNRIFIFLSRTGLGFLLLLLVLLFMAINYQNNLIFGLTFWLFSLLMVVIYHTYGNFSGLEIQAGSGSPAFVGEVASFQLYLRSHKRERVAIQLGWPGEGLHTVWLAPDEERCITLRHIAGHRGLFSPPRVRLESHFPLGLLRTWSWVALDWRALVYPAPVWPGELPSAPGEVDGEATLAEPWGDDFAGFHEYQPGDSLRRAYWRAYAKGQPLLIMDHSQSLEREIWLDWNKLPTLALEPRLSGLCAWALDCDKRGVPFGLRLPGTEILPDKGEQHLQRCLKALALFDVEAGYE